MDVSEDLDGCLEVKQHILRHEDFHRFINKELDRLLVEFDGLAPCPIFDLDQLLNNQVDDKFAFCFGLRRYEILVLLEPALDAIQRLLIDAEFGAVVRMR